jgi:phytanoyl-CoA hydroxylase
MNTNTMLSPSTLRFSQSVEVHPRELYHATQIATPLRGFEAVDDRALDQYREQGFLAIEGAFSPAEVQTARDAILDLVAGRVAGYDGLEFEASAQGKLDGLTTEQRMDHVRKCMTFVDHEPRLQAMSQDPRLMRILHRLIGPEIVMQQDMALLKPPGGREKPWHQDKAYFDIAVDTPVVGIWIALDPVDAENGCMHVLQGGHRQGPRLHWQRRDWQICDNEMLNLACTAVPLRAGGCLIFDGMIPHGTPHNRTNLRRRALQFHYRPAQVVKTPPEVRLAAYGSEGKNVSC